MTIIKHTTAMEQIDTFCTDNWEKVGELVRYILDNRKKAALDRLAEKKFPNGCSETEFKKWICGEAKGIIRKLG